MRRPPAFATLTMTLALAACASSDPKLYTLIPTNPTTPPVTIPGPAPVVELRRVNIPGYLDRPEIVRSSEDYRVHLEHDNRWSEPFGDLLQRLLTDDLTRRLPGGITYSDDGAITAKPTTIVEIDIARLDSDGAGQVVLDAQFSLRGPDDADPTLTRATHITAPITAPDTASYAAAISAAAAELTDAVAAALSHTTAQPPAT